MSAKRDSRSLSCAVTPIPSGMTIESKSSPGVLGIFIILSLLVQLCLNNQIFLGGTLLFIIGFFFIDRSDRIQWHTTDDAGTNSLTDLFLILGLWSTYIVVRSYHVESYHNIGDLSARYGFGVCQILKGIHHFPFFTQYEFDESLVSYLFAPFCFWWGVSWTTLKLISICFSSLLIPIVYLYTKEITDRCSAIAACCFLVLSYYFQKCDPLIEMLRFNLVASLIFLSAWIVQRVLSSGSLSCLTSVTLGLISGVGIYFHSIGRLIPLLTIMYFLIFGLHSTKKDKWMHIWNNMILFLLVATIIALPLIYSICSDKGYLFFKNRQIFGLHEHYPFSWKGFIKNGISVIGTFNYQAGKQYFFHSEKPLLDFWSASGVWGGLVFILKNRKYYKFQSMMLTILLTTMPLVLVTPGPWRGLYWAPAVAAITILSAIWWVHAIRALAKRSVFCMIFLLFLAMVRIPSFYHGPMSPGPASDQVTMLFEDLSTEPDVPFFFSRNLEQCMPGIALFEFTKGAYLSEYHVFMVNPLRFMIGYEFESILDDSMLDGRSACLVFAKDDSPEIPRVQKMFDASYLDILPKSQLKILRINYSGE